MPNPTLTKTWQFTFGGGTPTTNFFPSTTTYLTARQELMYRIKRILTEVALGAWTVELSSDSSTAGSGDRWLAASNLVWATGAHSWIVLKQTGIASNFQICIDLNRADSGFIDLYVSPSAGFSGGSTTARPTASDEYAGRINERWIASFTSGSPVILHGMVSTDGQCSRLILTIAGYTVGALFFERFQTNHPLPASYPIPFLTFTGGQNSELLHGYLFDAINGYAQNNAISFSRCSLGRFQLFWTPDSWGNDIFAVRAGAGQGELDRASPLSTISVGGQFALSRGRLGMIQDMWVGHRAVGTGGVYPDDLTRQYAQFGYVVVPWDGSKPRVG